MPQKPDSALRPGRLLALSAFTLVAVLGAAPDAVAESPINKSLLGGVAIKGYDPVAYFEAGKPVKGKKSHATKWKGATWRFSSAENRDKFVADPVAFAPQYGGYCAWAVSQGYTAGIDPDSWKIVDGRLYLNYSKSVQEKWEADIPGFIALADENYPKIVDEE